MSVFKMEIQWVLPALGPRHLAKTGWSRKKSMITSLEEQEGLFAIGARGIADS